MVLSANGEFCHMNLKFEHSFFVLKNIYFGIISSRVWSQGSPLYLYMEFWYILSSNVLPPRLITLWYIIDKVVAKEWFFSMQPFVRLKHPGTSFYFCSSAQANKIPRIFLTPALLMSPIGALQHVSIILRNWTLREIPLPIYW